MEIVKYFYSNSSVYSKMFFFNKKRGFEILSYRGKPEFSRNSINLVSSSQSKALNRLK